MNCLLDTSSFVSPCSPGSWNPLGCVAEMSCPPHPWGISVLLSLVGRQNTVRQWCCHSLGHDNTTGWSGKTSVNSIPEYRNLGRKILHSSLAGLSFNISVYFQQKSNDCHCWWYLNSGEQWGWLWGGFGFWVFPLSVGR